MSPRYWPIIEKHNGLTISAISRKIQIEKN